MTGLQDLGLRASTSHNLQYKYIEVTIEIGGETEFLNACMCDLICLCLYRYLYTQSPFLHK